MTVPISTYIDVTVNLIGAVADTFNFGVPMVVDFHDVTANRQDGPFASQADSRAAGFTEAATPNIDAAIGAIFGQTPTVDSVMIGKRIAAPGTIAASVLQVTAIGPVFVDETANFNSATDADWNVFPAVEATGDYAAIGMPQTFSQVSLDNLNGTAGVGGTVDWEYWNGSAWVALTGLVDGTTGFTAAVADGQVVSFTVPVDWATLSLDSGPPLFFIRAIVTGVYSANPIYDQGFTGSDADLDASLTAINAVDPNAWYLTIIGTRTDVDISDLASWTQANGGGDFPKFAIAQTASNALISGTPGNIGEVLRTASYDRTALIYHALDSEALDGAWVGRCLAFDLDGVLSVGDWAYKQLVGITGDTLNSVQVANIQAENANFYAPVKGLTFPFDGVTPFGSPRYIDTITTADWVKVRMQEAVIAARVGAPTMIAFDDPGIQFLGGVVQGVANQGVTAGHFLGEASGATNPRTTVPLLKDVSSTDLANRNLRVTLDASKRNSILTVELTINLNLTGI